MLQISRYHQVDSGSVCNTLIRWSIEIFTIENETKIYRSHGTSSFENSQDYCIQFAFTRRTKSCKICLNKNSPLASSKTKQRRGHWRPPRILLLFRDEHHVSSSAYNLRTIYIFEITISQIAMPLQRAHLDSFCKIGLVNTCCPV